jgi:ATP-dependent Clp protease protease subunit
MAILKKDREEIPELWVIKFDPEAAQKFREHMLALSKEDEHKPITIYIDSYGGYVDSLAKMLETMDEVPNPKITVCMGVAMSCGAILLSHGDIRFCSQHSRVMLHEVSSGAWGKTQDLKVDAHETNRLNEWAMGLLAKNCNIKDGYKGLRKVFKDRDNTDLYLDAKEALAFGIVDAVGVPKVNTVAGYEISAIAPKQGRVPMVPKPPKSESKRKGKGKVK